MAFHWGDIFESPHAFSFDQCCLWWRERHWVKEISQGYLLTQFASLELQIDHPQQQQKGAWRSVVSTQRKRAVIACFRQTSLHSLPRSVPILQLSVAVPRCIYSTFESFERILRSFASILNIIIHPVVARKIVLLTWYFFHSNIGCYFCLDEAITVVKHDNISLHLRNSWLFILHLYHYTCYW